MSGEQMRSAIRRSNIKCFSFYPARNRAGRCLHDAQLDDPPSGLSDVHGHLTPSLCLTHERHARKKRRTEEALMLNLRECPVRYTPWLMPTKKKNSAAQALNRLRNESLSPEERSAIARSAGLEGGLARAEKLTKQRRKEIAEKAARARWGKKNLAKPTKKKAIK